MIKPTIITNSKNWIESAAVKQLEGLSKLNGVIKSVGLPDLHAGKSPIGIAIVTENIIYPHIIGNDIGCGMSLYDLNINSKKLKLERWVNRLNSIRELSDIPLVKSYSNEISPIFDLGSIGGGNHFAEFQMVEEIFDEDEFNSLNIAHKNILLLVHSGSRGYGNSILKRFGKSEGIIGDSETGKSYVDEHNNAVKWAEINRNAICDKLIDYLGYSSNPQLKINSVHNFLEKSEKNNFIHRKGAISSANEFSIIPGSRGTLTYIVKPTNNTEKSAWSLSHGAGRKWSRSLCKVRIKDKYDYKSIRETKFKGRVVCHDTSLLFEEAPEAYKNINNVIDSLLEFDLIKVVATLKPVLTFKG